MAVVQKAFNMSNMRQKAQMKFVKDNRHLSQRIPDAARLITAGISFANRVVHDPCSNSVVSLRKVGTSTQKRLLSLCWSSKSASRGYLGICLEGLDTCHRMVCPVVLSILNIECSLKISGTILSIHAQYLPVLHVFVSSPVPHG